MGIVRVKEKENKVLLKELVTGEIFKLGSKVYIIIGYNSDDELIIDDFDSDNFNLVLDAKTFRVDAINKNTVVIPQEADLIISDPKEEE